METNMTIERTLSIVKPDAVAKNVIGQIYSRFENNGLKIVAAKMKHLSQAEAEGFYAVHKERPFFADRSAIPSLLMSTAVGLDNPPPSDDAIILRIRVPFGSPVF